MRDVTEAAHVLMIASDDVLSNIVCRDPDMIRDVAAAVVSNRTNTRKHDEDCELRGGGPCYCSNLFPALKDKHRERRKDS